MKIIDVTMPPSRLSEAPLGQIWRVTNDNGAIELYIQTGLEDPNWVRLGSLIEKSIAENHTHD